MDGQIRPWTGHQDLRRAVAAQISAPGKGCSFALEGKHCRKFKADIATDAAAALGSALRGEIDRLDVSGLEPKLHEAIVLIQETSGQRLLRLAVLRAAGIASEG